MHAPTLPQIVTASPAHVRRLANGLTVIVREHRVSPVVALVAWVRAGYFDEPDEVAGISHVLEHMYFKGTPARGPGEMARQTKALGGVLNASTSYDHTRYHTVLPADALEQAMEIQADALKHSRIDEDELKRELGVIIEEAKRKRDAPAAYAREMLYAMLFDVHRMRRWRIGTEEALAGFTREQVLAYYRSRYRAEAVTLAIAGDIDAEHAFDLAERHYADVAGSGAAVPPGPREPERREFRFRELSGDITRTHIDWGWRAPPTGDGDVAALDLAGVVLGQGRASRLYREVREAGHALSVAAGNFDTAEIGVFGVSAEARPERTGEALDAMAGSLMRLLEHGVRPDEIRRARAMHVARLLRMLETAQGHANFLARWQSLGDWRMGVEHLDRIERTTHVEVTEAARRWLAPDRAAVLVYRPDDAPAETRSVAELAKVLFGGAAAPPERAPQPTPAPLPGPRLRPEHEEDGVRFYRKGALRIAIQPRPGSGLASLAIVSSGGGIYETAASAGTARLVARTSVKGTHGRDAARIAIESEDLGASIHAHADADIADWRLTVPAGSVDRGLELLADVALRPSFPEAEFEREREIALEDVRHVRDDMVAYPFSLLLAGAFPDHPYGFSLDTLEASLRGMRPEAMAAWHARHVAGEELWVIVVGDVEADAVAGLAARHVEAAVSPPTREAPPPSTWPVRSLEVAAFLARAQSAIAIGLPGPVRATPDHYALQLAANAIGGLGGRVFEELRSRRSLAYTVSISAFARRYAGSFIGYIATSPVRENEARTQLLAEMLRLRDDGVTPEELERARRHALGAWQIRRQTGAALLSDLIGALVLGAGLEEIRHFADRVAAVDVSAVRDAAGRWLDPDRAIYGVVHGKAGMTARGA